jgi:hypothetical protein
MVRFASYASPVLRRPEPAGLFANIARVTSQLNVPHLASQSTSLGCDFTQCFLDCIVTAR